MKLLISPLHLLENWLAVHVGTQLRRTVEDVSISVDIGVDGLYLGLRWFHSGSQWLRCGRHSWSDSGSISWLSWMVYDVLSHGKPPLWVPVVFINLLSPIRLRRAGGREGVGAPEVMHILI